MAKKTSSLAWRGGGVNIWRRLGESQCGENISQAYQAAVISRKISAIKNSAKISAAIKAKIMAALYQRNEMALMQHVWQYQHQHGGMAAMA
jgi:hypothetical protein